MRILWVISIFLSVLLLAGARDVVSPSMGEEIIVEWDVPITAPGGNHLNWYEMKADPENKNNLIVCGAILDAHNNGYYGVVYSSHNGGKSWRIALEDHSSAWVSEQSCAFGEQHMAYFISDASKVIDGEPHHNLGTTRIFVSFDAGETWILTAKTDWADYSNSVVGKTPGSDAQQLYVFYNGNSKDKEAKKLGSTLDFFTVSENGTKVSQRQTVRSITERDYQGIYPSSSVVLNDGAPIVLYDAGKKSNVANEMISLEIGVVRLTPDGSSPLTIIATHSARYEPPVCPATLSNSLAYDRNASLLYVAYNEIASGHCAVMLTKSRDEGQTWSTPHELRAGGESHPSMYFPVLSVNKDGVIGLLWRGKQEKSPDCWYFSISRDGLNLDETVSLSPCVNQDSLKDQSSSYLATVIQHTDAGQPVSVDLLTFRDYLTRVGITATPDGVFHPLWSTSGDGDGELRTARIRVGQRLQPAPVQPIHALALTDVTDKIAVLYGGEQRLDHETNSAMLSISIRNNGPVPLQGPFYLKVENTTSDFGQIELVNPVPQTFLSTDYLDISSSFHGGALRPGGTTSPYHLTFHFAKTNSPGPSRYLIVKMKLRVFCQQQR